ncbi:pentatricopeptide repeat-containing protein At1g62930, chloroplastic-like [Telopea speciosissima]|uniref:pentatricopeptide repeat-containing protein At1g62930, chloroplastic-like n=1 Tax=Telopea speciosissima TaxID=54955 RepID=UPI001CC35D1F|nr:pentatricopeptide repeat-containing protein At1g62930, chloroplastic-like [Telopea speciosissima]
MVFEFLGDSLLWLNKYNSYSGLELNKPYESVGGSCAGLERLNRQQLLQVLLNSSMESGSPVYTVDESLVSLGFGFQYFLLAFAGISWVTEAMEMLLLSFVGPTVKAKNVFVASALVFLYVSLGRIFYARRLFDEIPRRDVVLWTAMLDGYAQHEEPMLGLMVFREMVGEGIQLDIVVMVSLLLICSQLCWLRHGNSVHVWNIGRLQKAFEIFEVMGRIGCQPTAQTYNCLLNGLCYRGRVEEACELLMKIKNSSKKPDIYTYTVVMDGFCKVGRSDEAMELLKEGLEMGQNPTMVTFNTLFNGYCKEGRPLEGISLLKQIKERDCHPDYITYSTLLHGLLKWSEIPAALQIYKEMLELGFEINERTSNLSPQEASHNTPPVCANAKLTAFFKPIDPGRYHNPMIAITQLPVRVCLVFDRGKLHLGRCMQLNLEDKIL